MPAQDEKRRAGYIGVWVLVIFALLAMTAILGMAAHDERLTIPIPFFAACALVVAGGLVIESRYDPLEFAQVTGVLAALVALVLGYVAIGEGAPLSAAALGATLASLVSAACIARWIQLANRREILREVLREEFDKRSIVEIDGVQFVGSPSHSEVLAGEEVVFRVHAQNAFDSPRTLYVQLAPHGKRLGGPWIEVDKQAHLVLPPGSAGILEIPIAIHPRASGRIDVRFEPRVEGSGGTRVRVFRGQPFRHRQHPALFAFFFVIGLLLTLVGQPSALALGRGGSHFRLKVRPNPDGRDRPPEPTPASEAWLVYEPERYELAHHMLAV